MKIAVLIMAAAATAAPPLSVEIISPGIFEMAGKAGQDDEDLMFTAAARVCRMALAVPLRDPREFKLRHYRKSISVSFRNYPFHKGSVHE